MANSRSNIYSVKLQGAELNLNKFDAEIKQYSGFNKNNSPFVGGCLSNLFTKTEENTTGSSDSVYVDDNGDVYYIENYALRKKNHETGEITSISLHNTSGVTVEEVKGLPDNTVYYYRAPDNKGEVYITLDIDYAEIKYRKDGYETTKVLVLRQGTFKTNEILFNVECCRNNLYVSVNYTYTQWYSSSPDVFAIKNNNLLFYIQVPTSVTPTPSFENVVEYSGFDSLVNANTAILYDSTFDRVYYVLNRADKCYVIDNSNQTLLNESTTSSLIDDTQVSGAETYSSVKYCFTKRFGWSTYLAYIFDVTIRTSGSVGLVKPICSARVGNPGNINDFKIILTDPNNEFGYFNGARQGDHFEIGTLEDKYCIQNYGAFYGLSVTRGNSFSYCGVSEKEVTSNITVRQDINGKNHAMLEMGCVAGGVLFNNGVASGICTNYGNVLLTEWNSVDKNYIFPQGSGFLAWKDINTKKIYIYKSTGNLWLKYINGQLVTNVDSKSNAYDLKTQKLVSFAYAWNNRALFTNFVNVNKVTLSTNTPQNDLYAASAVNEYNLQDNTSLLLNPIPVVCDFYEEGIDLKLLPDVTKNNFFVNYYSGESEILYKFSKKFTFDVEVSNIRLFYKQEYLLDLPFPLDTNGNVQLSPSLFCESKSFGNDVFIKEGSNAYQLIKDGAESVMSYYLGTLIENLEDIFILQGQYYAIINKQIFNVQFSGGVVQSLSFVVSVENLQFCGNSAYQAYFFSKTNRCIYVFTGANILNQLQLVDKISEIYAYKYNQSTQSIILITDLGTIVSSNLGMYLIEGFTPDDVFFYDKGVVFVSDSELTYLQYYEADGFEKHNIEVETCFYGMNNETVTINDCLYIRLFSEEHEEGEVKVSATTISLKGRKTETTVFKFKASDWDALTHSVYVRYQPKEQRGLGISFSINSPFKIASLSVGSKADAILVDKVSKGAVITPSNNDEW